MKLLISDAGNAPLCQEAIAATYDAAGLGETGMQTVVAKFRPRVAASILAELCKEEGRLDLATIGQPYIVL